jgi:predicted nucleic acid-binding protein
LLPSKLLLLFEMTVIGGNVTTSSLFVPDASVILKWAFESPDEPDGDKALELLNRWLAGTCDFILPKLWAFECGNVLGLKNPVHAEEIMGILIGYRFTECELTKNLSSVTLQLMWDCKITFYDAVYHAVAQEYRGTLITADAAYYRKAGMKGRIMMLDELS